jgi:superfamily II DNA helicase RecQ
MGMQIEASGLLGRQMILQEQDGLVQIEVSEAQQAAASAEAPSKQAKEMEEASEANVSAREEMTAEEDAGASPAEDLPLPDGKLYDALVMLRNHIAQKEQRKPYLVFHDDTLRQISTSRPLAMEALLAIRGIGKAKAQQYGALLFAVIRQGRFEAPAETEVS